MNAHTRQPFRLFMLLLLALALAVPVQGAPSGAAFTGPERKVLQMYAEDTWQSFVALVYPSGLPADNLSADGDLARYTSPTNIGAYIWSTLAARDLQIIQPREARQRIAQTLDAVAKLERHAESGQFYNWYDPLTGETLHVWPPSGDPV
jgi:hypothetical protein